MFENTFKTDFMKLFYVIAILFFAIKVTAQDTALLQRLPSNQKFVTAYAKERFLKAETGLNYWLNRVRNNENMEEFFYVDGKYSKSAISGNIDIAMISDKSIDVTAYRKELQFYENYAIKKRERDNFVKDSLREASSKQRITQAETTAKNNFKASKDWFITTDIKTAGILADSITSSSKRRFKFVGYKITDKPESKLTFSYISDEKVDNNKNEDLIRMYTKLKLMDPVQKVEYIGMRVVFDIYMKGSNEDLEIKGTPQYTFHNVEGKFLDLFPFWQKFIKADAKATDLSNVGRDDLQLNDTDVNKLNFSFQKRGYIWDLFMYRSK